MYWSFAFSTTQDLVNLSKMLQFLKNNAATFNANGMVIFNYELETI